VTATASVPCRGCNAAVNCPRHCSHAAHYRPCTSKRFALPPTQTTAVTAFCLPVSIVPVVHCKTNVSRYSTKIRSSIDTED
jgi:hypothetical protein